MLVVVGAGREGPRPSASVVLGVGAYARPLHGSRRSGRAARGGGAAGPAPGRGRARARERGGACALQLGRRRALGADLRGHARGCWSGRRRWRDLARTAVVRDGALALAGTRRRLADFMALSKPRVVLMVVLTTLVGYYLGASGDLDSCGCSTSSWGRPWRPAARSRSTSSSSVTWTPGCSGPGGGPCRTGAFSRARRPPSARSRRWEGWRTSWCAGPAARPPVTAVISVALPRGVHAAQAGEPALHGAGRDSRAPCRPVAGWVAARGELGVGRGGALRDHVPRGSFPHARHRSAVPGGLRAGRHPGPAGGRPRRRQHRAADRDGLSRAPCGGSPADARQAHRGRLLFRRPRRSARCSWSSARLRRSGPRCCPRGAWSSPPSIYLRSCWCSWPWTRWANPCPSARRTCSPRGGPPRRAARPQSPDGARPGGLDRRSSCSRRAVVAWLRN